MSSASIEDFYDVPATEVLLVGGPHDGRRMYAPDGRTEWVMPPPPPVPTLDHFREVAEKARRGQYETVMDKATLYRWTGSVLDDGTRVFRC